MAKYQPAEFYMQPKYLGCSINHDDSAALVSCDISGILNLFKCSINDSSTTQLTHSKEASMIAISCFPKDDRLLYSSDICGNELTHLYVMDSKGEVLDLTPGEELKAEFCSWKDDNCAFFVITNERNNRVFDLYRYSSSDYQRELIFVNDDCWAIEKISPNGVWLSLRKVTSNASSDIYLVNLDTTNKEPILVTSQKNNIQHQSYAFTPDSKKLIYSTDQYSEFTQVWSLELGNLKKVLCYKNKWDILSIFFSDDGKYCVYYINADGRNLAEIIEVATSKKLDITRLPPGNIKDIRFTSDSKKIVFYIYSDAQPARLYSFELASNKLKSLLPVQDGSLDPKHLVQSEVIRFNSFDGVKIPGNLFRPKMANSKSKVPALIWIHGGPGGQFRSGYKADIQCLINHGYAVLGINNRGSRGYGKTFFHLDDKKHGDHDLKDIVQGKFYLQDLDWIDETKIGVIGSSYGGYLTMAALTFTNEFQLGIDIFGVTNWLRTLTSMPSWWEPKKKALYDEMGDPATDSARHKAISPLFHASKISKPIMVVQGANDPRVLQIESDEIVAEIRKNNIPVDYLLFPDEGHGFNKKSNQIIASTAYIKFLNKYL